MQSRSDSCPVSIDTVQAVYRCPETEEEWKKAMERKNCSSYAKMCDEPYRLVYHCVINSYINQLIEVCAYTQNIVGGKIFKICLSTLPFCFGMYTMRLNFTQSCVLYNFIWICCSN